MRILLLFVVCLVMSSCFTQGDCLVSATNNLRIQFKKKNTATDTAVTITYIEISGTDSILVPTIVSSKLAYLVLPKTAAIPDPTTALSDFLIPINGHTDTTRFIFHRIKASDPTVADADILTLKYDIQGIVATSDCGAYNYYQNLRVIRFNRGDSLLKMYNRNLAKNPTSQEYAINLRIYF